MCIAGLHVTTAPCSHRWYELIKPCNQSSDLANCPERLRLQGWETRHEGICPWCTGSEPHLATHRLFGSTSSASSVASSPSDSAPPGRSSRRGSVNTLNGLTLGPLSRQSSTSSVMEFERAQRSKDMNDRIHAYLCSDLHEVLPSAKKYYPTYASILETGDDDNTASSNTSLRRFNSQRSTFTRGWKRMSSRLFVKPV
ncbi:uncharacterized protein RCC_02220 [Ramularia collo-cygni]|uniref:Uncharacterized protein n=1 Tax=Ramularia collo-cygni TaxID=112498 RepID=A0A2D3UW29_9PEZI|nr:uncharacterized protein RCC_02220 [Ramularia collo-cygni]CZT16377.1 uncharacterized protein RCC_02220 [Ramularia collo-cygni]